MKKPVPPTVQVLANDLYINANMDKQLSIEILKNGWSLVDSGILFINECVFQSQNSPQSFSESVDQCTVLIRLLRETEKYGKRTVDIFALGEAGERMGSNLCSSFKSNIVRLSKRKATHPAGVARRFSDLYDPGCTLGAPPLSKSLAKHLSNHVASLYTMAKDSQLSIALQRQADAIRSVGHHFPELQKVLQEFITLQAELGKMEPTHNENYSNMIDKLTEAGNLVVFRLSVTAASIHQMNTTTAGIGGFVAKAGPSLGTVNPSQNSIQQHVGKEFKPTPQRPATKSMKLNLSGSKKPVDTADSSQFSNISAAPSVRSMTSTGTSGAIKLNFGKSNMSTTSTQQKSVANTITSNVSDTPTEQGKGESSALGTQFRKLKLTHNTSALDSIGEKGKGKTKEVSSQLKLTKEQINQLSSVDAVVQANGVDVFEGSDAEQILEEIQHDISHKTIYNAPVRDLVAAINKDLEADSKFDFTQWAMDNTKSSATYDTCKELFGF